MPIVRDLNDMRLLKHVLIVAFIESKSGGLPVVFDTYTTDTEDGDYPGQEQFLRNLRTELFDQYSKQESNARCCGLMMMTSESPISVDPGRTVPMSHVISLSLTAPLEWSAMEAMESGSVEGLVFNASEADLPIGGTITMDDIRSILDDETGEGMMIYGPMIYGSESEITAYMGGIDAPNENFADIGRRMLASLIIETTAREMDSYNQMEEALAEYLSGECEKCEDRDECSDYAAIREMFPGGRGEAILQAALLLAKFIGSDDEEGDPMDDYYTVDEDDGGPMDERADHDNDDEI